MQGRDEGVETSDPGPTPTLQELARRMRIASFPVARDTRPLARARSRLTSRTSRRRFRSKHTTTSNMFTVAYGPDSTALAGFVRTFVALAHAYYVLCIAFGALAFVPEPVATRMPRILQIFRNVLLNSVGRGKTYDHKSALRLGKGLNGIVNQLLSASVPKRWFSHLYHVAVCWNFACLCLLCFSCACLPEATNVTKLLATLGHRNAIVALACVQLHVSRRLYENYFVHAHSSEGRMQLFGYAFGLLYYVFLPANFFTPGVVRNLDLGRACAPDISHFEQVFRGTFGPLELTFFGVFLFGNLMQYQSHVMLASLRTKKGGADSAGAKGKGRYKIPEGFWFAYLSNPHYLAEVVLYVGFISLAKSWNRETGLLIVMVVMNLLLSAMMTHQWYKEIFRNYPKKRYAMFPLII